jgi:transposase
LPDAGELRLRKIGHRPRPFVSRKRISQRARVCLPNAAFERTNAKGDPLTFDVTGGEAHEVKGYETLMKLHDVDPDRLLGDKGYDNDEIRDDLVERGIEPVIPLRSNRKTQIEYDREAFKRRNLIKRCVSRLKQFRRIAARYEKPPELTSRCYASQQQGSGSKLSTRAA